jgi:ankyrin repeat protein
VALENRKLDTARFLVGHTGSEDSQQSIDLTALGTTSQDAPPDVAQPSLGHTSVGNILDKTKTSLHTASEEGNLGIVKSLIDDGADVNERWTYCTTPMHFAAMAGKVEVAKLLVEYDANVNSRDRSGWAPLHMASRCGHFDIAHLLLNHSADVNAKSRSHDTALHLASKFITSRSSSYYLNMVRMSMCGMTRARHHLNWHRERRMGDCATVFRLRDTRSVRVL